MNLSVKQGASVRGLRPEIIMAVIVAAGVYAEYEKPCVLTEGTGGKHRKHSLHNKGLAIDLRVRDPEGKWELSQEQVEEIVMKLSYRLGAEFQVVNEYDHIHIEFDPE
jgi:hypothetical protein